MRELWNFRKDIPSCDVTQGAAGSRKGEYFLSLYRIKNKGLEDAIITIGVSNQGKTH